MTSTRLVFLTACGLVVPWAFAASARAESSVSLSYRAPEGCPSQTDFMAAVAARGGHFETPEAASRLRSLDVAIRKDTRGFEGSLRLEAREGAPAVRQVQGGDCSEVASGLAVVAAIALKGDSDEAAPQPAPEEPPSALSAPSASPPERTPTPAPEPAPEAKPRLAANSFKRDPLVQVEAGSLRFDRVRNYTLSAGVDYGLLPGLLMPRYELSSSVANSVTPPSMASYLVGPVIQVYWTWLGPGTIQPPPRTRTRSPSKPSQRRETARSCRFASRAS